MLKAERRALTTGQVLAPDAKPLTSRSISAVMPEEGTPARWYNAVVPILVIIVGVIFGMLWSGRSAVEAEGIAFSLLSVDTWKVAFGSARSDQVLLAASVAGSIVAIGLAVLQRILSLGEAITTWLRGIPAMALAVSILISAWAIKTVCSDLGTNTFLVSAIGDAVPVVLFPLMTFLVAAAVAFATGTSWGTMGILLPMIVPWAWSLSEATGDPLIVLLSAAAVLDGAIMGDHCSPISDTTVMSSIASSCDHVDHVRTQMPYAVSTMAVAACGYAALAAGAPWWMVMLGGILIICCLFLVIGKRIEVVG